MRIFRIGFLAVSLILPRVGAGEPEEAAAEPSLEDLYDTGKALFDAFAPEEIKAEYEFPDRAHWDTFAARLQSALDNDRLEDLAVYEPEARAAAVALRAIPGGDEYADWLEERLDYIMAAKAAVAAPPPLVKPEGPKQVRAAAIPYLDLWRERMSARPVPERAAGLVPKLRKIFAAEGVPEALVWMAEAESTFNPNARSPVGARGLFQFMPATAKEFGLSTFFPDDRADPAKSARTAAQYLKQLHGRFGDWPLAIAAYNAGGGRVSRTLTKNNATTFAEISAALPSETRMYVPKVLATLEVRAGVTLERL
ncbi:MAG: lytic transglycosylase domain-containing protein [Cephaloticoccus sp.]|nr:lytic transglycosylase domain-containing protein [Cephaloticoccus sp.]MCF7760866.1 lytic transglycosylase domain-containing protein [Cephaloticoccus sp.]